MICPICHKREATEEVVRYFNTLKAEGFVCPYCLDYAKSLDANQFYAVFYTNLNKKCSRCGRELSIILETMIVGCPHCYTEFADQLKPLIDSVQRRF